MYAPFFGLKQEPFSIAPDPRYLFMSKRHREALAHLLYGVKSGGGFVLLSGEIGAGKTTVCRCFLEQIPKRCNVAYIFNPKLTVTELLSSVCDEFGIPYSTPGLEPATVKDYLDPLNAFLLRTHAVGQKNILIIDEAQMLSADVLEQLRLLTNLETNERKLLQIVLIGQPELRTMLARPELEQLAQRVIARFHLKALSASETQRYIAHRLAVAGLASGTPFDRGAMERIHVLSRGVPRRINLLCDRAMLGAYSQGTHKIGKDIIDKAAREVFGQSEPLPSGRSKWRRLASLWTGVAVVVLGAGYTASLLVAAHAEGGVALAALSTRDGAADGLKPVRAARPPAMSAPAPDAKTAMAMAETSAVGAAPPVTATAPNAAGNAGVANPPASPSTHGQETDEHGSAPVAKTNAPTAPSASPSPTVTPAPTALSPSLVGLTPTVSAPPHPSFSRVASVGAKPIEPPPAQAVPSAASPSLTASRLNASASPPERRAAHASPGTPRTAQAAAQGVVVNDFTSSTAASRKGPTALRDSGEFSSSHPPQTAAVTYSTAAPSRPGDTSWRTSSRPGQPDRAAGVEEIQWRRNGPWE